MQVRDRVPTFLLAVLGLGALVYNLGFVMNPGEPALSVVFGAIAAAMGGVLVLGAAWMWETDLPPVEHWRTLAVTVLGMGVTAAWFVFFVGFQASHGVELADVTFLLSAIVSLGAGTWFLVGLYHSRRTQAERMLRERADDLEREREKLDILNRVLRHNVLNGMAVIQGHVAQVEAEAEGEDQESLETAQVWCGKVTDLVQEVRQILQTMTEEGREVEPVDICEVIQEEVGDVRKRFPDADVRLDGPAVEPCFVQADDLLGPVLENVLRNAVQHNDRPDPTVSVSVEDRGDTVHVSVADDGPGIDDVTKDHVLEREAYALDEKGTGLGLFLADRAVAEWGGMLRIRDNQPRGAVVTMELPPADGSGVAHA